MVHRACCLLALVASGCDFTPGVLPDSPIDAAIGGRSDAVDADIDGSTIVTIDAACMIGSLDLCAQAAPDPALALSGTLDTTSDSRCRTFTQAGGVPACLIFAEGVTVANLIGVGARPLIIASRGTIMITGTLDVSSRRNGPLGAGGNHTSCALTRQAELDNGGAAGAAGGSFRGKGGDGGEGDTDDSLGGDGTALPGLASNAIAFPNFARGGCPGGSGGNEGVGGIGGAPGNGGGAVWIAATDTVTIATSGAIRATGAGAGGGQVQSGGGGGGSGGMVMIEAPTIVVDGPIAANGGGGGEGGTRVSGTPVAGNPGFDGDLGVNPAAGGSGAMGSGGDGGFGGALTLNGTSGGSTIVGAGGGGGGAGFVKLVGAKQGTGAISPASI